MLREHPTAAARTVATARRHGVVSRVLRGVALQISPPLVVTEAELETIVGGIAAALEETLSAL